MENKKTNNLKAVRLTILLMSGAMVTSFLAVGTLSKYSTGDAANGSANVAKWGVTIEVDGTKAFANKYGESVVASVTTNNIVAPGTSSEEINGGIHFSINGKPEVKTKLSISMKEASDVYLKAGNYKDYTGLTNDDTFEIKNDYHPILFTLTHAYGKDGQSIMPTDVEANGGVAAGYSASYTVENDTTNKKVVISGTLADINNVFATVSSNNESISANHLFEDSFTLSWSWTFADHEQEDTLLGNLIASADYQNCKWDASEKKYVAIASDDYSTALSYKLAINLEQLD